MLIVLRICLFLMPYDSGFTSLGNRETIILYTISNSHSRGMYYNFWGKFDFQPHYSSDGSYIRFYSQHLKLF